MSEISFFPFEKPLFWKAVPERHGPHALSAKDAVERAMIAYHEMRCFSNSSVSARSPAFLAALTVEKNSVDCVTGLEWPAR
jgi:hypothetical protein